MDSYADPCLPCGFKDPPAAFYVYPANELLVTPRLDQPRQVDHGIRSLEERSELVGRHIGCNEGRLGPSGLGLATRDPDDRVNLRLTRERVENMGSDISGGAGDDDSHCP